MTHARFRLPLRVYDFIPISSFDMICLYMSLVSRWISLGNSTRHVSRTRRVDFFVFCCGSYKHQSPRSRDMRETVANFARRRENEIGDDV